MNGGWVTVVKGYFNAIKANFWRSETWRYEIYAPDGIWIAATLSDRYQFPSQDEVCYVAGIAPQYTRSAQLFRLLINTGSRYTRRERVDNVLIINSNFSPQFHPERQISIQRPISYYIDENGTRRSLSISRYHPNDGPYNTTSFQKRDLRTTSLIDWYMDGVGNLESYVDAAFRSSRKNEAYLFMKNEYLLLNYAPGSTNDRVVNGPLLIRDGFPSLKGTPFAEYGIDCAFGSHNHNESFIFSGIFCARINFAPGTTDDYIIDGPMIITRMFSFFRKTVFENGVDAAFESSTKYEAYLFKGDQYALINYNNGGSSSTPRFIAIRPISQGFGGLRNTIFESGFDAAFSSHYNHKEAYLFKGDSYALMNFAPGSTNDYIIGGVKKILPNNWPSLRPILPRYNRGIDLPADEPSSVGQPGGHQEL
ncbi:albumin-2-like [Chenopodium quinoa]|uniref:albumin-2-like n=1 Tax=Chenopodium quinoa TaxID=63459 RepID=UPI000B78AD5C|nr:albumin-2-like [Chenopodium quinoa]